MLEKPRVIKLEPDYNAFGDSSWAKYTSPNARGVEYVDKEYYDKLDRVARYLWSLLDDIDTLDDSCRTDALLFRESVRRVQQKRFKVGTVDDGQEIILDI